MERVGWSLKRGVKVVPLLVVFQMPPLRGAM